MDYLRAKFALNLFSQLHRRNSHSTLHSSRLVSARLHNRTYANKRRLTYRKAIRHRGYYLLFILPRFNRFDDDGLCRRKPQVLRLSAAKYIPRSVFRDSQNAESVVVSVARASRLLPTPFFSRAVKRKRAGLSTNFMRIIKTRVDRTPRFYRHFRRRYLRRAARFTAAKTPAEL